MEIISVYIVGTYSLHMSKSTLKHVKKRHTSSGGSILYVQSFILQLHLYTIHDGKKENDFKCQ